MEAAGIIDHLINYFQNDNYCLKKVEREINSRQVSHDKKSLTLKSLSGAFFILGIGYSLAIIVFIVEIFYGRIKKNIRPRKVNL